MGDSVDVVCVHNNDTDRILTEKDDCAKKADAGCVWMENWPKEKYYCSIGDIASGEKSWCVDAKVDISNEPRGVCFKDTGNVAEKVEIQVGKLIDDGKRKLINSYSCLDNVPECTQHSVATCKSFSKKDTCISADSCHWFEDLDSNFELSYNDEKESKQKGQCLAREFVDSDEMTKQFGKKIGDNFMTDGIKCDGKVCTHKTIFDLERERTRLNQNECQIYPEAFNKTKLGQATGQPFVWGGTVDDKTANSGCILRGNVLNFNTNQTIQDCNVGSNQCYWLVPL